MVLWVLVLFFAVSIDLDDTDLGFLTSVKLANDVTYRRYTYAPSNLLAPILNEYRMNQTMEKIKKLDESQYTTLTRVLFGLDSPSPVTADSKELEDQIGHLEFYDPTLNDSQKDAIQFALASREVALIHGPPGVRQVHIPGSVEVRLTLSRLERHTPSSS